MTIIYLKEKKMPLEKPMAILKGTGRTMILTSSDIVIYPLPLAKSNLVDYHHSQRVYHPR